MATSVTKTYSIDVTYSYGDGSTINADDLHVVELRAKIKQWISEQCSVQQGILQAVPGTVSET